MSSDRHCLTREQTNCWTWMFLFPIFAPTTLPLILVNKALGVLISHALTPILLSILVNIAMNILFLLRVISGNAYQRAQESLSSYLVPPLRLLTRLSADTHHQHKVRGIISSFSLFLFWCGGLLSLHTICRICGLTHLKAEPVIISQA